VVKWKKQNNKSEFSLEEKWEKVKNGEGFRKDANGFWGKCVSTKMTVTGENGMVLKNVY